MTHLIPLPLRPAGTGVVYVNPRYVAVVFPAGDVATIRLTDQTEVRTSLSAPEVLELLQCRVQVPVTTLEPPPSLPAPERIPAHMTTEARKSLDGSAAHDVV